MALAFCADLALTWCFGARFALSSKRAWTCKNFQDCVSVRSVYCVKASIKATPIPLVCLDAVRFQLILSELLFATLESMIAFHQPLND